MTTVLSKNTAKNFAKDKRSGFGIAEAIVTTAVVTVGIAAMSSLFLATNSETKKSRIVQTMVALESSVLAAYEDPESFRALVQMLRDAETAGTDPLPFDLKIVDVVVAHHPSAGAPIWFNEDGDPCVGDGTTCDIGVEFKMRAIAGGGFEAGYRISAAPKYVGKFALAPLGSRNELTSPSASFDLALPQRFYKDLNGACGSGIARGMNKITGEIHCWSAPKLADACPAGRIMRGYQAKTVGSKLVPICAKLRAAGCSQAHHVLASINPLYLDPDIALPAVPSDGGECILITGETATMKNYSCPWGFAVYHLQTSNGPCVRNPGFPQKTPVDFTKVPGNGVPL